MMRAVVRHALSFANSSVETRLTPQHSLTTRSETLTGQGAANRFVGSPFVFV
jgi:hypothetical protein